MRLPPTLQLSVVVVGSGYSGSPVRATALIEFAVEERTILSSTCSAQSESSLASCIPELVSLSPLESPATIVAAAFGVALLLLLLCYVCSMYFCHRRRKGEGQLLYQPLCLSEQWVM